MTEGGIGMGVVGLRRMEDEEATEEGFRGFPTKRVLEEEIVCGSDDTSAILRLETLFTTTVLEGSGIVTGATGDSEPSGNLHFFLDRWHS
jgi:hypothetical protein